MISILHNLVIRTHPHDEASTALVTAAVTLADATVLRCHFGPFEPQKSVRRHLFFENL